MSTFLPITLEEVKRLGWTQVDVVIVSGDAYVDHPSFGTAVIGRVLERAGFRVAIIPQPNWRDDLRDFRKFGAPRLFFGVTSGVMDSMVNHYTAARRLRHDDAYTPGGAAGFRPDYATYVYSRILKELYPEVPVVVGGVEASMRRLAHYDYWSDRLKPPMLAECPADLLAYGMAEKTMVKIAELLDSGAEMEELYDLPQVAYRFLGVKETGVKELRQINSSTNNQLNNIIKLHSFAECCASKRAQAENFHIIERESNKMRAAALVQEYDAEGWSVVVNPPEPPMSSEELDASFDLPYTRLPHPKYRKRGTVPAYEMIKHSINSHRGCFGGCSFCTISAHQGKTVVSRSRESIVREVQQVTAMEDFHGTITDLGGPSANMYGMHGRDARRCASCSRYSCIQPSHCDNLVSDHQPIVELYRTVRGMRGVKHLFIGSGIRTDLFTAENKGWDYFEEVVLHHVSGRLKVAPEHTEPEVLKQMRKPPFDNFVDTKRRFDEICRRAGLRYQLIPYFISSHPGCRLQDMARLAVTMKRMGYRLEQVQDFTPTPMTRSTEMYYTGIDPDTMQPVYVATRPEEKQQQRMLFFYYKRELQPQIKQALRKNHLEDYINKLV